VKITFERGGYEGLGERSGEGGGKRRERKKNQREKLMHSLLLGTMMERLLRGDVGLKGGLAMFIGLRLEKITGNGKVRRQ